MLFSLFHTETGSFSQSKLLAFEEGRLIQSLFGYHHLTLSLMEEGVLPDEAILGLPQSKIASPKTGSQ